MTIAVKCENWGMPLGLKSQQKGEKGFLQQKCVAILQIGSWGKNKGTEELESRVTKKKPTE